MTRSLRPLAGAVVTAGLLAGCGGGADDAGAVRDTLARLGEATAAHDYHALCSQILAPALVNSVAATGLPCETALKAGLGTVKEPRLQSSPVEIHGAEAPPPAHTSPSVH